MAVADADILPQFDFLPASSPPLSSVEDESLVREDTPAENPILREETPVGLPPLERKKTRLVSELL